MELAKRGDHDAFGRIVGWHGDMAFRLASSIVGSSIADDVVQDAFVDAWTHLGSLRHADRFESWLRMIIVNRCRATLLSARRRPVVVLSDYVVGGDINGIESHAPADFIGRVDQHVALEEAYSRLGFDSRVILSLHYVADLPISQVAKDLGVPVGTAKSRLNKALRDMRDRLEAD